MITLRTLPIQYQKKKTFGFSWGSGRAGLGQNSGINTDHDEYLVVVMTGYTIL